MGNPEHVKVVLAGRFAVLDWRKEHEGQRLDLREADLRGGELLQTNLERADLRGANLRGTVLRLANLIQADLRKADLREADLSGAVLFQADLRGADLRGADLDRTDFKNAHMSLVQRIQGWRGVWRK